MTIHYIHHYTVDSDVYSFCNKRYQRGTQTTRNIREVTCDTCREIADSGGTQTKGELVTNG